MFSFLLWKSFGNDFYYRFIKSFSTFGIIWLRENTKYVIKWYSHFLVALRHAKYGQNSDISIVLIKVDVCDVMVRSYTATTWSSIFGDIAWKLAGSFDIRLRLAIRQSLHAVIGWKLVVKTAIAEIWHFSDPETIYFMRKSSMYFHCSNYSFDIALDLEMMRHFHNFQMTRK